MQRFGKTFKIGLGTLVIFLTMIIFPSVKAQTQSSSNNSTSNNTSVSTDSTAGTNQTGSLKPSTNKGKKWRVGYIESFTYANYAGTLAGIVNGLSTIGWLQHTSGLPYQSGQSSTDAMWNWLSSHDLGPYMQFVPDAHYSFQSGNPATINTQLINRIKKQKDLDLLIVMGTYAGEQIAKDHLSIPCLVFSSSNPVQAKIVQSDNYSGESNLWAQTDPLRYQRQIQVFYDLFHFKSLGVMYENSADGKIYAALSDVQAVAKQDGFKVVAYPIQPPKNPNNPGAQYYADVLKGNEYLSEHSQAVYLTAGDWKSTDLPKLLQPFWNQHIPIFSQEGATDVKYGALLSIFRANFNGVGRFGAETMAKALNGESLAKIPQLYVETPDIVINLAVANKVHYNVPFDVLLSADKIDLSIAGTKGQ